jgi:hypothetical protein
MSRRPCTYRQRDLETALKAARAADLEVVGYTVGKDGTIKVITGKPGDAPATQVNPNEWDDLL